MTSEPGRTSSMSRVSSPRSGQMNDEARLAVRAVLRSESALLDVAAFHPPGIVFAVELEQIKQLVASCVYLNASDFVRDAVRDKLAAIKTIKYRDVDYDTAIIDR
jgi:hypothetical protein